VPSVPAVTWQSPEQQSELLLQTSPFWMQNDAPSWQTPALHRLEQQAWLLSQGLPAVRQTTLSALHTPPSQFPLQQAAESVHAWSSATQSA
jgi:hypothetical protein